MSKIFLVDGPPGTGKTTYLARQAKRAATEHGADRVAIASLTRTAAAEIAGRDTGIPDDNVGTLHAHAYRGLDRPDLAETPDGIRAFNEHHPALQLTGGQTGLEDTPVEAEHGGKTRADELHAQVMNHRARLTPREQWTEEQRAYADQWDDFKRQTDRVDFTDLIETAIEEMPCHPALPSVMLLDEAQDFSALELKLAVHWAQATRTTVIVGDTDQALYAWRGSDPGSLNRLEVAGRRALQQSHRVPAAVHQAAVDWVQQIPGRTPVTYRPTAEPGMVRRLGYSLRYPAPILDEIRQDLDDGRSVMVLTSCGYMLAPVLHLLREQGLPFHNPHRVTQGAWNPMRAASRLLAFLRPDRTVWGTNARDWSWDDLRLWTDPLKAQGVLARGAKTFLEEKCRADRFGQSRKDETPDGMTVANALFGITDPNAWLDHPACRLDVDWWESNLRANQAKTAGYPLTVLREQGPYALVDQPRVTVGTIHSVKGGEADSVYVFPDLSRQGMWHGWRPGGPGRDQIVRMFYVALTRARQSVTVLDPAGPEHAPLSSALNPEAIAA